METLDPQKETEAFVEMVKLYTCQPDLKEIAVFFPDATLISDEDFKDPNFGLGLFLLMRTDPFRFALIVEKHVRNYNYLGVRLVEYSEVPEGKLVGMFILSVALKNSGEHLFSEIPSPEFFRDLCLKLEKLVKMESTEEIIEGIQNLPFPEGVKEKFKHIVYPKCYWYFFKKVFKKEDEIPLSYLIEFLASLNSIYSALFLMSLRVKHANFK